MANIRLATVHDAEHIQSIYAPFVRETVTSFERDIPAVDEIRRRIATTLVFHPWLVCERESNVLGYAYAGYHRTREAYRWSVDTSVYFRGGYQRRGIGRGLYVALLELVGIQGFVNAFAGITLPNPESVGLHEALGYSPVGTYQNVGFKLGGWHHVGWWQRQLRPLPDSPRLPKAVNTVRDTREWDAAITAGEAMIRLT